MKRAPYESVTMDTQSGRNRANAVGRYGPIFLLLTAVVLTGSKCVVSFSSGHSSDDEDTDHIDKHHTGHFVDAPVDGVRFVAGALSGRTGPNGEYRYETAGSVAFFIGDIALGQAAPGQEFITPLDLVAGGTLDTTAVINIARLLQSLDAVRGDAKITIPAGVHGLAVVSNDAVAAAIEFLDMLIRLTQADF